jgi:hypothetical protein
MMYIRKIHSGCGEQGEKKANEKPTRSTMPILGLTYLV